MTNEKVMFVTLIAKLHKKLSFEIRYSIDGLSNGVQITSGKKRKGKIIDNANNLLNLRECDNKQYILNLSKCIDAIDSFNFNIKTTIYGPMGPKLNVKDLL